MMNDPTVGSVFLTKPAKTPQQANIFSGENERKRDGGEFGDFGDLENFRDCRNGERLTKFLKFCPKHNRRLIY